MSQPPRCRTCGKAEWGHTCLLGWIEIEPDAGKLAERGTLPRVMHRLSGQPRDKPLPRPAPPRVIRREPDRTVIEEDHERAAPPRAAPGKRRSLSFRALDDEGLRNLYNAVMAEKMRRAKKEPE